MKPWRLLPLFFAANLLAVAARAQQPLDWIPRGVEQIGRTAAFHTDFTFDRTMLQMASGVFYGDDPGVAHAVARLNGISVHSYRFAAPGMYDPRALEAVREQYRAAGWKHMVSAQSDGGYNNTGHTDLWISFQGVDVTGMVLLLATDRNLNLIALTGDLSPLDLLHLRGHFGIPKFAGDGFEPAPESSARRRHPYPASRPAPAPATPPAPAYPPTYPSQGVYPDAQSGPPQPYTVPLHQHPAPQSPESAYPQPPSPNAPYSPPQNQTPPYPPAQDSGAPYPDGGQSSPAPSYPPQPAQKPSPYVHP